MFCRCNRLRGFDASAERPQFESSRQRLTAERLSGNSPVIVYGLVNLMFEIALQHDLIDRSPVRPKIHKPDDASVSKSTPQRDQIITILMLLS